MSGAGRREPVLRALLKWGDAPTLLLPEGVTPTHLATLREDAGGGCCLGVLLRHGGDPNTRSAEELTPLHVAVSWGCCGCLRLLLKKGGDAEPRDQDGKRGIDLVLEQDNRARLRILRDSRRARGWPPAEEPGGPRRSLSFLTEDGTEGSVSSGLPEDGAEAGPLSSTRRSLLEEPDLGGGCKPPRRLASLAAGDATPRGPEPPRHRHVTPRTKSRLQASAERLGTSSSSSLFDEMPEMPRRPPRLRAPRGVRRDPATSLGHCVTPGAEDVSSGDGEGTGSLDDTEILPGAPSQPSLPPGASSSPSPTVLLCPGDNDLPQDSPSDARGPPGSSPTVLLCPGDHDLPQDSPSDARGPPGSSPTVLLCPGDHGLPQDSPSDARDPPCATGSPKPTVLEGGSGRQDPSPLGTHQPLWSHGSFSRLPAPRPPGSTVVELGSPAMPHSPAGCSTHGSKEHLEDEERGQAPTERHSPGTEATTSPKDAAVQGGRACTALLRPLSDEGLRRRLRALGDDPGPVTKLTRRLYLRRLEELVRGPRGKTAGHSPELAAALQTGHVPDCAQDELALVRQFDRPDRSRRWREGLVKSSFNYLLLDPRTTQNLPLRSHRLSPAECFRTFVKAIFYVGKGTRARPYCHLAEALSQHRARTQKGCPKVRRILEIWASGQGIISVHCFQSTVPAEAYTREGCLVEALGLQTITNQRKGNCYGVAASWPAERRRRLGVHMLHRAMRIFLAEGERQLWPADIQGGR
ncbi:ankyrin repeat and LEM domain-containing protein 1 [Gavia stellata]|uniref:ankyrin repeat and LEM domain-containing protein 1 n=1 Tax=Gavia stellata TaxID=37040 RepID=UPI00289AF996|nr:ankyrin repeat and LEM domain-containing protein 1 [Gavia stellata]